MITHRRIKSLLGIFLVATTGLTIHATTQPYKNIVEYKKLAPKYADDFAKGKNPTIQHHATAALTFLHVNNAALAKAIADDVKKAKKMVKATPSLEPAFNLLINAIFFDNQMPKALSSQHPNDARKLVKYIDKAKASGTTKGGSTQTEADAKKALNALNTLLQNTIGYHDHAANVEDAIYFLGLIANNHIDASGNFNYSGAPALDPAKQAALKNVSAYITTGTTPKIDAHAGILETALKTEVSKISGADQTVLKAIIANATTGQLHQDVLAFIAAFNKAAAGSKKVAKTPTELQKHYKDLLEAAVPAAYNFTTAGAGGGGKLADDPDSTAGWFTPAVDKQVVDANKPAAIGAVKAANLARENAQSLIDSIAKVDAADGKMKTTAEVEITDKQIKDEIKQAKSELDKAVTAVKAAFKDAPKKGDKTDVLADAAAFWKDFDANLKLINDETTAKKALENLFVNPKNTTQKFITYDESTNKITPAHADAYNALETDELEKITRLKEALEPHLGSVIFNRLEMNLDNMS